MARMEEIPAAKGSLSWTGGCEQLAVEGEQGPQREDAGPWAARLTLAKLSPQPASCRTQKKKGNKEIDYTCAQTAGSPGMAERETLPRLEKGGWPWWRRETEPHKEAWAGTEMTNFC